MLGQYSQNHGQIHSISSDTISLRRDNIQEYIDTTIPACFTFSDIRRPQSSLDLWRFSKLLGSDSEASLRRLSVRMDDFDVTRALVRLEGALTTHFTATRAFVRYIVSVECDVAQSSIARIVPVCFVVDGNGTRIDILNVAGQSVAQSTLLRKNNSFAIGKERNGG